MIIVGGESLIDLVDNGDGSFQSFSGGSPYNCARVAACLGVPTLFAGRFSSDSFGKKLLADLTSTGAKPLISELVNNPTSLAVVHIGDRNAPQYAFYRENTADRYISVPTIIKAMPEKPFLFHMGSLAFSDQPDSIHWLAVLDEVKTRGALISVDPNCRPLFIPDRESYLDRFELLLKKVDLLKLSDDDLVYLYPGVDIDDALEGLVDRFSIPLAILTKGKDGMSGHTCNGVKVTVDAFLPDLISDTIGAGDTVQGALIQTIFESNLTRLGLELLDHKLLREMCLYASIAAGINCTRPGCQPPTKSEILNLRQNII